MRFCGNAGENEGMREAVALPTDGKGAQPEMTVPPIMLDAPSRHELDLFVVLNERENVEALQLFAAIQKSELHGEGGDLHLAAQQLD